jgi:hypothetical protein
MFRMMVSGLLVGVVASTACSADDEDGEVWQSDVTKLVISSSGGFEAVTEPTEECPHSGTEYTLTFASKKLDAWRCRANDGGELEKQTVSVTLTQAELDALQPKLAALQLDDDGRCQGADKPSVSLALTTPSGTTAYRDGFYACEADPRLAIEYQTLDALYGAIDTLAFPPLVGG